MVVQQPQFLYSPSFVGSKKSPLKNHRLFLGEKKTCLFSTPHRFVWVKKPGDSPIPGGLWDLLLRRNLVGQGFAGAQHIDGRFILSGASWTLSCFRRMKGGKHIYIYMYTYVYMCMCKVICYVYIYIYIYMYVCVCVYICIMCIYVLYVYICIYIYTIDIYQKILQ